VRHNILPRKAIVFSCSAVCSNGYFKTRPSPRCHIISHIAWGPLRQQAIMASDFVRSIYIYIYIASIYAIIICHCQLTNNLSKETYNSKLLVWLCVVNCYVQLSSCWLQATTRCMLSTSGGTGTHYTYDINSGCRPRVRFSRWSLILWSCW